MIKMQRNILISVKKKPPNLIENATSGGIFGAFCIEGASMRASGSAPNLCISQICILKSD